MTEWDLRIGAQVHCKDGKCGKLLALLTDPETDEITDVVVEKGLLLKKDRVKSEYVCRAAIAVAAAQTRVIRVLSELEIHPADEA